MDVRYLLHLEAALERYGIVDASADEEYIVHVHELRREPLELILRFEYLLYLFGQRVKLGNIIGVLVGVKMSAHRREVYRDEIRHDELR